jgi:ABC-type polysaccharide/polyol phosphate export permease
MPAATDFYRALRVQLRVIGALLMWEVITRYGRDNLGFVWLFLEPMIFTLSITALWYAVGLSHSSNLPIVAFALTGYSSVLIWRNCAARCTMAVQQNTGLLFHRPVRALDVLVTKILLEIAGASISFLALSTFWISIGWMDFPDDLLRAIEGWLLLAWFGGALALNIGALTSLTELAERLWHPTSYILFPLSGAVFMVDWLAEEFKQVVLWIPQVHCVEMIRDGFFGASVHTRYDPGYVALVALLVTLSGLALTHVASRRLNFR